MLTVRLVVSIIANFLIMAMLGLTGLVICHFQPHHRPTERLYLAEIMCRAWTVCAEPLLFQHPPRDEAFDLFVEAFPSFSIGLANRSERQDFFLWAQRTSRELMNLDALFYEVMIRRPNVESFLLHVPRESSWTRGYLQRAQRLTLIYIVRVTLRNGLGKSVEFLRVIARQG